MRRLGELTWTEAEALKAAQPIVLLLTTFTVIFIAAMPLLVIFTIGDTERLVPEGRTALRGERHRVGRGEGSDLQKRTANQLERVEAERLGDAGG